MAVQVFIGPVHHHLQSLSPAGVTVDLRVDVAEEVGVIETAPARIGAADGHAGNVDRRDQLGAVLGHLKIEFRGRHANMDRRLRFQMPLVDEELAQRYSVGGRRVCGGLPARFPLRLVISVDLRLPRRALVQKFLVLGTELLD